MEDLNDVLHNAKMAIELKKENEKLKVALWQMLNVYDELHAMYNLGDCEATIDARRLLYKCQL